MRFITPTLFFILTAPFAFSAQFSVPDLPEAWLVETYKQAAGKNVLAAVNPEVFPGYWSVCADGQGFGYGNSYPSLDGHQLADALVRLGQIETVKLNWEYVKTFQKPDGSFPLAILPGAAGQMLPYDTPVDANGGLYKHWVPGDPLAALADPTYIANAEIIFLVTQDKNWLANNIESINKSADHLISLTTEDGRVRGAGYYVERPTRIESDGVTQSHAVDAFRKVAALNQVLQRTSDAERYAKQAEKIEAFFVKNFWDDEKQIFAEYYSPERGYITNHGYTDSDWAAIALSVATPEQAKRLYPKLKNAKEFFYGTMPAGIATKPKSYEDWEFSHPDRHDLGAMGRVWYLTAGAQAKMNDADSLLAGLKAVAEEGAKNDYYWRERYHPSEDGSSNPAGPNTYCEYPANLIRIVQRYLLGVDLQLDGSLALSPCVPDSFWEKGFGQEIQLPGRTLSYRFTKNGVSGKYQGEKPLCLKIRFNPNDKPAEEMLLRTAEKEVSCTREGDYFVAVLEPGNTFEIYPKKK